MHFSRKTHRAFSIVELMISVAIIGILTAIIFGDFKNESGRIALKAAVRQLQIDVQKMQTNAQGGVSVSAATEQGYGIYFPSARPLTSYQTFADTSVPTSIDGYRYIYNTFAPPPASVPPADVDIATRTFPADVRIVSISGNSGTITTGLSTEYLMQSGKAYNTTYSTAPSAFPGTTADVGTVTITLKNIKINVCYAISVTAVVGTVTQRKLATCP